MNHRSHLAAALLAAALSLGVTLPPAVAQAEGESSQQLQATADQLMAEVREKVRAYNEASERVGDLEARIFKGEAAIADIEGQLPAKRQLAARSVKSLYKMSQDDAGLVGLILCSEDFESFVANLQYLDAVTAYNDEQVADLAQAQSDLQTAQATLEVQRQQAEDERRAADEALSAAQDAAAQAQRAADEARAEEQARAAAAAALGGGSLSQASSPDEAIATTDGLLRQAGLSPAGDDAPEGEDRDAFVGRWAPRLDAYLAGRPLAGQGAAFAGAAWDAGIDPRWSAAESMLESGAGAACFAPYNAYGWLARGGFSSWEEGIREHATYLRGTYGTSPTPAAAALYLVGDPAALAESSEYYQSLLAEVAKI